MARRVTCPAGLLLSFAAAAWGQGGEPGPQGQAEPPACEEGRPSQVRLSAKLPSESPVALVWLQGAVGADTASREWGQARKALPLSPHLGAEVVTLELVASEDLGRSAVARLPRPDVRAGLEGPGFVLCRLVRPGEQLGVTLSLVPRAGKPQASLSWRAFALDPLAGGVYVRQRSHVWRPGEEGGGDGPGRLIPRGGPPPAGPSGPSGPSVALRVELTRWAPWKGQQVQEVLVDGETFAKLEQVQGTAEVALQVRPAAFGLAAAAKRAGLEVEPAHAVRLPDDRWVLQQPGAWWVVPGEGDVEKGSGEVFPFVLDLARTGRAGFVWYQHDARPALAEALRAEGFSRGDGKGLTIEVGADRLTEFLLLLAKHQARLTANGIGLDR